MGGQELCWCPMSGQDTAGMLDTHQQGWNRTTPGWQQATQTDFLPCHSASSVSKYCSLHLNLIRIFLGVCCPYLLLVSPHQQMLAYLCWDPDKICATPAMLESSPTSSELKSLMWLDVIQISLCTLLSKTAMPAWELPSQQQKLLENGSFLKSHIFYHSGLLFRAVAIRPVSILLCHQLPC